MPFRRPDPGFRQLLGRNGKNTTCFYTFSKTSILTPRILSFSLFSLSLLRRWRRGRILEAYAIPPTPLEAAHDFQGIRSQNSIFKAFQREVRHLNRFSEVSSGFLNQL